MQDCLLRVVSDVRPAFIHVAIPCGTGSRAREKPIPRHLKQAGAPEPRQLRDKNFLLGFPDLSPNERARVEAANELARFTIQLFSVAVAQGTILCIENPLNSWMWGVLTHFANTLLPQNQAIVWHAMRNIECPNCAHGGERPKMTLFKCTHPCLQALHARCPGNHAHKPYALTRNHGGWQFDTAKESEYPPLLCKRIVNLVRECLKDRFDFHVDRASSGRRQTKHSRALIPEYHHITKHPPAAHLSYKELPPLQRGDIFGEEDKLNGVANDESMQFGVYHTPSQFVKLAQMARHPCDHLFSVEDNTRDNLFDFLTKGPNYIAKQRIEFARRVAIMAKELQPEEDRFFCTLPMHAQSVLRGKRLLLFRELLKQCGCPDLEPANLILGTDLVGTPSKSPLFDTKIKPATSTPEYALLTSTWQRKKMEA